MRCVFCGAETRDGTRVCSSCGSPVLLTLLPMAFRDEEVPTDSETNEVAKIAHQVMQESGIVTVDDYPVGVTWAWLRKAGLESVARELCRRFPEAQAVGIQSLIGSLVDDGLYEHVVALYSAACRALPPDEMLQRVLHSCSELLDPLRPVFPAVAEEYRLVCQSAREYSEDDSFDPGCLEASKTLLRVSERASHGNWDLGAHENYTVYSLRFAGSLGYCTCHAYLADHGSPEKAMEHIKLAAGCAAEAVKFAALESEDLYGTQYPFWEEAARDLALGLVVS